MSLNKEEGTRKKKPGRDGLEPRTSQVLGAAKSEESEGLVKISLILAMAIYLSYFADGNGLR